MDDADRQELFIAGGKSMFNDKWMLVWFSVGVIVIVCTVLG